LINGELVAKGPTGEIFTEDNIRRTFSMPVFSEKPRHP